MNKIITNISILKTIEGENVQFTYSVIDENGEFIQRNLVRNFIAVNPEIINAIELIRKSLIDRIPDIEQ